MPKLSRPSPSSSATDWSLLRAASGDGPEARVSREAVAHRYWGAVFAFVRATGQSPEAAADLTQGFFADVLIGRSLLASADATRGRFRSLLRKSVVNYVRDHVRHEKSTKRSPKDGVVSSRDAVQLDGIGALRTAAAERVFDAHWAAQVVRVAGERAEARCRREGRESAWTAFELRTLRPQLFGDAPVPYSDLARKLDIKSIGQAAHLAVVGRRVFVEELLEEVRATLGPEENVADELRESTGSGESRRKRERRAPDSSGSSGMPGAFRWALDANADPSRTAADWLAREIVPMARDAASAVAGTSSTLEQLVALKVAFKALRIGAASTAERNRAARLYAATIAAGLVRFGVKISRQSDAVLRRAFLSLRNDTSCEESLRDLATVAITRCSD
jgi:DNA-directed RNA polymerase specialized sigma24 family protein